MRKASVQLSVNFLVIVILAIAFFSFALAFGFKMFRSAGELADKVDDATMHAIEQSLDTGQKVVFPLAAKQGKVNKIVLFPIGVRNIFDSGMDFEIKVAPLNAMLIQPASGSETITINAQDKRIYNIAIKPNSVGEHKFKVDVCFDNQNDNAGCGTNPLLDHYTQSKTLTVIVE